MRVPVVGKSYGNWKEQLGITRSWKVWYEIGKDEAEKFGLKLGSSGLSSKVQLKLKIFDLTWKDSMRLESYR